MEVRDIDGFRFVEGFPDRPLMRKPEDTTLLLEVCFAARVRFALLYAPNLTAAFFDLSSREAGTILQRLRTYQLRLAVVCPAGTVRFSTMFAEMVAEEKARGYFAVFETADAARQWLAAA